MNKKIRPKKLSTRLVGFFLIVFLLILTQITQINAIPTASKRYAPNFDTFINLGDGDSNYGGQEYLRVGYSTEYDFYNNKALLAFNLATLPADIVINSILFSVYWTSVSETFNVSVCRISTFDEYSVTWNTAPSFPTSSLDSILVGSDWERTTWDLSSLFINTSMLYLGIFTTTDTTDYCRFYSREGENSILGDDRPRLTIDYSSSPSPSNSDSYTSSGFELFIVFTSLSILIIFLQIVKQKKVLKE